MFPEDRVLVGVIKRVKDFNIARDKHWYRIPQHQMPYGVYDEYLAFYLSGSAARKHPSSGVYYYARKTGLELARRRDLLPDEADKDQADDVYYQVFLGELQAKDPPIVNPTKRSVVFIRTTWDRFIQAEQISDLYSVADYYVDRIYHALRDAKVRVQRYWEADRRAGYAPGVRVLCEQGAFTGNYSGVFGAGIKG